MYINNKKHQKTNKQLDYLLWAFNLLLAAILFSMLLFILV